MSNTYNDLENNFPDSIDNFDKFQDPNVSSIPLINTYYRYIQSGDLSGAASILINNPQLKPMIINAETLNQLRDGLISVERFYLNDVQQYLVNIIKYRDEWSGTTRYNKYDVVIYTNGGSRQAYMGIVNNIPVGTVPTNTAYWVPLAIKGDQGESGLNLSFQGTYNNAEAYPANVAVEYQGSLYGSLQPTQGNPPTAGGSNQYWALAWNFQIPNNYITYDMLANSLKTTLNEINIMTDNTTGDKYRFGVDDGLVYIEEV